MPYFLVFIALLPMLALRDYTPSNELRYLSIADEALQNHTYFAFTNHGLSYADKPPLYLWLVMLCKWLTGRHVAWLLSLFSLIPAFVIVYVMDRWAGDEMDQRFRPAAGLMLTTAAFFVGTAVVLRMDMLMCMFIVLALQSFWRLANEREVKPRERWLFPIFTFLALFTKGPVGLLVPLLVTIIYLIIRGRIREIGRYWGWRSWLVLLVGCAVWFTGAYIEGGAEYLDNLLFHQTVDRAVNAFHHKEPFYYYGIVIWYCLAPWCLLVVGVFVSLLLPRSRRSELQIYFITAALSTFVMLSCFSSKLAVYLLPSFPFIVYAAAISTAENSKNIWIRLAVIIPSVIFVLALPGAIAAVRINDLSYLNHWGVYAGGTVLTVTGIYSLYIFCRKRSDLISGIKTMAVGFLLAAFCLGWAIPKMNPYIGYGALAEKATEVAESVGVEEFASWHVKRSENMDVYLHATVRNLTDEGLEPEEFPRPSVLMLRVKDLPSFPEYEAEIVGKYAVLALPAEANPEDNAEAVLGDNTEAVPEDNTEAVPEDL